MTKTFYAKRTCQNYDGTTIPCIKKINLDNDTESNTDHTFDDAFFTTCNAPPFPKEKMDSLKDDYLNKKNTFEMRYENSNSNTSSTPVTVEQFINIYTQSFEPNIVDNEKPDGVVFIGGNAVGKSTLYSTFDQIKYVKCGYDDILEKLSSYRNVANTNTVSNSAALNCYGLVMIIYDKLIERCIKHRYNVMLEFTPRGIMQAMVSIDKLLENQYNINVYIKTLSNVDKAITRSKHRAIKTGRLVPKHIVTGSYDNQYIIKDMLETRYGNNNLHIREMNGDNDNDIITTGGKRINYIKLDKKFPYNNREYVVYKAHNKQFIKLKGEYHPVSSLQKQTYKSLNKKVEYKGKSYPLYQKLDNSRKFIMIDNKRKYVS